MPSNRDAVEGADKAEAGGGEAGATATGLGRGLASAIAEDAGLRVALRSNIVDQLFLKQELLNKREEEIRKRAKVVDDFSQLVDRQRKALENERASFENEVTSVRKFEARERGRVVLNVGGRTFETSVETLATKSGFFKALFSGAWDDAGADSVFIDRDPNHFGVLLSFLRNNGDVECLSEHCYEAAKSHGTSALLGLLREAEFFQIEEAIETVEDFLRHKEDVASAFDMITLNVGGESFVTSRRTLCLCPFFDNLLAGYTNHGKVPASKFSRLEPIFLDRNPKFFAILLDYLRSGCDRKVLKLHISLLPDELISYFKDDMSNFYELNA